MRWIGEGEIDAALDHARLADALATAFRAGATVPTRHHHPIETAPDGASLLLMPAWTADYVGIKILTLFPGNRANGLDTIQGGVLLCGGRDGRPLALLDGARLTVWRTAAASALAARHLARPDAARMVMVGAGALAPFWCGRTRPRGRSAASRSGTAGPRARSGSPRPSPPRGSTPSR